MLESFRTSKFKTDFILAEKQHKNIDKLVETMDMIIQEEPLPPELRNHPFPGNWAGAFECHVTPDWVLIYMINPAAHTVTFHCIGSHSDLFWHINSLFITP